MYRNKSLETYMVSCVGMSGRLGSRKAFGRENKPPFFKATAKRNRNLSTFKLKCLSTFKLKYSLEQCAYNSIVVYICIYFLHARYFFMLLLLTADFFQT